jgi:hypothetical protein
MAIETQRYIRKPLYVDAVRITKSNFDEIAAWCQGEVLQDEVPGGGKKYIKVRVHNPKNPRQTRAYVGDWLLYTERGYKVYTSKAFHTAFDNVSEVEPKFPLFYIDPATGALTEDQPHEEAKALTFEELMEIVQTITKPKIESNDDDIEIVEATPEAVADAMLGNEEARMALELPSEDASREGDISVMSSQIEVGGTDEIQGLVAQDSLPPEQEKVEPSAAEGRRVLSPKEQREMTSEELRDLLKEGDVVLAQDIAQP